MIEVKAEAREKEGKEKGVAVSCRKEIREWIREMDAEEKKEAIESAIGWAGLFWLMFMISIIGG